MYLLNVLLCLLKNVCKKHSAKILQQIVRRTGLPMPIRVGPHKKASQKRCQEGKKRKYFEDQQVCFFGFFKEKQEEIGQYIFEQENTPCSKTMPSPLARFPLTLIFGLLSRIFFFLRNQYERSAKKIYSGWYICHSMYRGWCIKFVTGLNIIIGIVQIQVEINQCPSHRSILLIQGPIHEIFKKKF